jgi:hypothetical protein
MNPKITDAWLAEKMVLYYKDEPVFIVAFKTKGFFLNWDEVMASVGGEVDIPVSIFVIVKGGDYAPLAKKVIKAGEKIL